MTIEQKMMPNKKRPCHGHVETKKGVASFKKLPCSWIIALCVFLFAYCTQGLEARASLAEAGNISWYGTSAHGKKTANGAVFNRNDLTAAHRTLPFGTVVRVYRPNSLHQVLVEITDRGPFSKNRVLDVSWRAAHQLGIKRAGVAYGVVEVASDRSGRPLNSSNAYFICLSESLPAQKAHQLSYALEMRLNTDVRALYSAQALKPGFILCVGPYETFAEARKAFLHFSQLASVVDIVEAPRTGGDLPLHVPPRVFPAIGEKSKKVSSSSGKKQKISARKNNTRELSKAAQKKAAKSGKNRDAL